ncbi:unnamed protein product [Pleuronectes platessa]|uniref:Uncharacterized protein n=1 Tax=Pleuronectes platessa TaxID=8262 RepID=A0A9N7VG40_PLEPL|nr:unnamed protein product [Pleuronectes platessa]
MAIRHFGMHMTFWSVDHPLYPLSQKRDYDEREINHGEEEEEEGGGGGGGGGGGAGGGLIDTSRSAAIHMLLPGNQLYCLRSELQPEKYKVSAETTKLGVSSSSERLQPSVTEERGNKVLGFTGNPVRAAEGSSSSLQDLGLA